MHTEKEKNGISLYVFMVLVFLAFTIGIGFGIPLSQKIASEQTEPLYTRSDKYFANNKTLSKVCLEGHIYYIYNPSGGEMAMAPKLDSLGDPCTCAPDIMEGR